MKIQATTTEAYELLHEGSLIMAEMEANGIRVDIDYVKRTQSWAAKRIKKLMTELKDDEVYTVWRKTYGADLNLDSRPQLGTILFDKMGYESSKETESGRHSTDVNALERLDIPFVQKYIKIAKLKKAKNTYLNNILKETVDGYMHPNFWLHLARTFRGSSSAPNFQNIPVRDLFIKKLIRQCFIARRGRRLVDLDFKGSEVNAASWYHKDPAMLKYIKTDPGRMHFDAAMDCYMLDKDQMTSEIRYCGKNKFVFPQFYGDWWLSCAKSLWYSIDRMNLKTAQGIPLKKWLKKKGITSLGTGDSKDIDPDSFEAHIKQVEESFWYDKFDKYRQWKENWWENYQEKGFLQMLSGFIVFGNLSRKDVINYPIQGTAFHCLLWCLIRIAKLLKKYKMKTLLIGQIHDDAVSDTPDKELDDYIDLAMDVIMNQLKKHWQFIITPMRVEVEVTPVEGSWYEKKEYEI